MTVLDWKVVKIPKSTYDIITRQAKIENVPRHVIITKAVQVYAVQQKNIGGIIKGREHVKGKKHPRGLWYAWKLMLSYAEFRILLKYRKCIPHTVLERYLKSLGDTLWQLRERLKVVTPEEINELSKLISEYMKNPNNLTLWKMNDLIRDIFYRVLTKG